jgi:cytochrome P450
VSVEAEAGAGGVGGAEEGGVGGAGGGAEGGRAEVDFDQYSDEFAQNRHAEWAKMRAGCPVAYNTQYGGFWAVSGYDEVVAVSRDGTTFSSLYEENPTDGIEYIGIMGVPRMPGVPSAKIAEAEGPTHVALRRLLNPFMLPSAVAEYRPFAERCATWLLDQKIADGHMDMVSDFTNPVPAILTMKMVGLPMESWPYYAEVFHAINAYSTDTPEYAQSLELMNEMIIELLKVAEVRRNDPKDDIISKLVAMEVDGRPLTDEDLVGVLWNLIGGGLDTTTSLTSLSLLHLDAHHDLRQRLVDEPDLLIPATEEFLRFTSVNETLSRTVTKDVELGGQKLSRGDFLVLSWLSANFDEKVFERPDEVILDRAPNPHMAFGVGPHRCIGMHIARSLFDVMMRELLARIPDYVVDREATDFYKGNPELAGVVAMPVTFTPGKPVGVERPF